MFKVSLALGAAAAGAHMCSFAPLQRGGVPGADKPGADSCAQTSGPCPSTPAGAPVAAYFAGDAAEFVLSKVRSLAASRALMSSSSSFLPHVQSISHAAPLPRTWTTTPRRAATSPSASGTRRASRCSLAPCATLPPSRCRNIVCAGQSPRTRLRATTSSSRCVGWHSQLPLIIARNGASVGAQGLCASPTRLTTPPHTPSDLLHGQHRCAARLLPVQRRAGSCGRHLGGGRGCGSPQGAPPLRLSSAGGRA